MSAALASQAGASSPAGPALPDAGVPEHLARQLREWVRSQPVEPHTVGMQWIVASSGYVCGGDALIGELEVTDLEVVIPPRTMHTLVMFLAVEGHARLGCGALTQEFDPRPGELVLLPAHEVIYARQEGRVKTVQLNIAPHRLRGAMRGRDRLAGLSALPLMAGISDPVLAALMHALHEAEAGNVGCGLDFIEGVVQSACSHLERRYCATPGSNATALSAAALHVVERLIAEQPAESLSAAEVSVLLGMTVARFERELMARTGQTFSRFARGHRLGLAYRALNETQASVTEVAHDFGFADLSHFSRSFAKRFGIPPSKLRR